ncbi:hypothetical protein N5079_27385 [Planotetraspora sp. A-T 1434]|uniref:hypothetical protein n=1 Tax=Planotetraspora sp. A-T 1434 TaxID=2979219 RepID=UPI0021C09215|nr:hypothetical protein [Planotetraspora sp. A-T 1434]MCT9933940.1 hypothetical protein [Planotetraspora sp. A-T 1434]
MDDTRAPGALPLILAVCSAGAAAVHFGVMPDHFGASWVHGVFFAAAGWAQFAWAAAVLVRPGQLLFLTGAFGNLALAVIWLVSRTAGFPVGPGAWTPEPVGAPDLLCALLEAVVIVGSLVLAERGRPSETSSGKSSETSGESSGGRSGERFEERSGERSVTKGKGAVVVVVSAVVAVAVGASFQPSFAGSVAASFARASTGQSAAVDPHGGHHHGGAPATPGAPTDAQITAADSLVQAARRETIARWPTDAAAEKDGYKVWTDSDGVRQLVKPAMIDDGVVLDATRPEALVYYRRPTGSSVLLGAIFIMPPGRRGPAIGGPLTPWHSHADPCLAALCQTGRTDVAGETEMLHVWLVDYPGGPFADAAGPALRTAVAKLPAG